MNDSPDPSAPAAVSRAWRQAAVCASAVAAAFIAALVQRLLLPMLGPSCSYLIMAPVALAVALLYGQVPGLLAAAVGVGVVELPGFTAETAVRSATMFIAAVCFALLGRRLRAEGRCSAAALEAAHLGLWYMELDSGKLHLSEKARELYGLPPAAPFEYEKILQLVHSDDRARVAIELKRVSREGGAFRAHYRCIRADGSERMLFSQARLQPGRRRRLIGVVQDVTDQKAAERLQQGSVPGSSREQP